MGAVNPIRNSKSHLFEFRAMHAQKSFSVCSIGIHCFVISRIPLAHTPVSSFGYAHFSKELQTGSQLEALEFQMSFVCPVLCFMT